MVIAALTALHLAGCEAELQLDGVSASLAQAVRRTDQFLAAELSETGGVVAFADNGVVVEASDATSLNWVRTELAPLTANFIGSTACASGTVYALSFENQLWSRQPTGWQPRSVPTEEQLQSVACSPSGTLLLTGAFGTLLKSDDSGESWKDLSFYDDFTLTAASFGTQEVGYAVGEFGTIAKSSDGGDSWVLLEPIADDFYPLSVHFSDAERGWVSGVLGVIFHTMDGGESWRREKADTPASLYGFIESDDGALYAYGDLGALLVRDPDSGSWVDFPSPDIPVHYADAVLRGDQLLLVGGWGLVVDVSLATTSPADHQIGEL